MSRSHITEAYEFGDSVAEALNAIGRGTEFSFLAAPDCLAEGSAAQFENVSHELMSPLFRPAVSHFWRCAEEPWVKLSGTA